MKIEYLKDSVVLNIAVAIFYNINMAFSLWERLPAANIALAACCQGSSPLSAVRKKRRSEATSTNLHSSIVNRHFYRL